MKRPAIAVAVLLLVLAAPWGVGAQEPVDVTVLEVGWWSSQPLALEQPDKGFQVAAGPEGEDQSIAALRLSIPATIIDSLQVRLVEVSSGSFGTEFGVLRVCSTTGTWTAANPGAYADAPQQDCTAAVSLTRTTDGVWLGDITPLAPNGGDVSLMIVPVYQPPAPVGPGMTVTIGAGDFTATGSTSTATTEFVPSDSGGGSGTPDQPSTDYLGSFDGGSFGVPPGDVVPDFGTSTTSVPQPTATTAPADDFALTPIDSEGAGSAPWVRLVFLVPLCAGFGVGVVHLRRFLAGRGRLSPA